MGSRLDGHCGEFLNVSAVHLVFDVPSCLPGRVVQPTCRRCALTLVALPLPATTKKAVCQLAHRTEARQEDGYSKRDPTSIVGNLAVMAHAIGR